MAVPQTHLVATGFIRLVMLKVFKKDLGLGEWFLFYLWGTVGLIDVDHFTSKSYRKDFVRRFKRILRGRDDDGPAADVKMPWEFLHTWVGIPIALVFLPVFIARLGFGLGLLNWALIVILPWAVHIIVDDYQKTPEGHTYISFWHPFRPNWRRENGYPVKSQTEIKIFLVLAIPIITFEAIWFFGKVF